MLHNSSRALFSYFTFLCGFIACSTSEENAFKGGASQKKPASMLSSKEGKASSNLGDSKDPPKVATATDYAFKLESRSGVMVCDGTIKLDIMTNFTINFPKAKLECLDGALKIDLAAILNGQRSNGNNISGLDHDGKVLKIATLQGVTFNPPRPVLIGPVVQNSSKYENFSKSYDTTVYRGSNANGPSIGKGTISIKVIDTNATFKNSYVGELKNLIYWEMTKSGFEGIKATEGLLFDRMEWWFSAKPIMIPKLVIEAELKDFIDDTLGVSDIVGKMKLTLAAKSFSS